MIRPIMYVILANAAASGPYIVVLFVDTAVYFDASGAWLVGSYSWRAVHGNRLQRNLQFRPSRTVAALLVLPKAKPRPHKP